MRGCVLELLILYYLPSTPGTAGSANVKGKQWLTWFVGRRAPKPKQRNILSDGDPKNQYKKIESVKPVIDTLTTSRFLVFL